MIHSLEAEQSVLSAILMGSVLPADVGLLEHHFFVGLHQEIWRTCTALENSGVTPDMITVGDKLPDHAVYIMELMESSKGSAHMVKDYAGIIMDKYQRRALWQAGVDLQMGAESDPIADLTGIANAATEAESGRDDDTPDHTEAMKNLFSVMRDRNEGRVKPGMSTGSADLDKIVKPLKGGDLVIIAGRPGMGKTVLMMDIIGVSCEEGPTLVFSLEMPRLQLYERLAASQSQISYDRIQSGELTDEDWGKFAMGMNKIHGWQLEIDDRGALSPAQIRAKTRKFKRKYGSIKAIFVDYMQIMQAGVKTDNRTGEIGYISGQLKALAKEFECPVVALSQLNRGVESRPDKRPKMSDLRESGAIEQDADLIIFPYRHEYYFPDDAEWKGLAEFIIGKQRGGLTGKVIRVFQGHYQRFIDHWGGDK
jgi:replicative DNA helicase